MQLLGSVLSHSRDSEKDGGYFFLWEGRAVIVLPGPLEMPRDR